MSGGQGEVKNIDLQGRTWLLKCLVGSHNYNLNTPESDRDYKLFFLPTFDDLYKNKDFNTKFLSDREDIEAHDIRKVERLWYKANVNFLEVLFSTEILINSNIDGLTKRLLYQMLSIGNDIAKMNLPYLFDACIGMHYNKIKYLEKGTEGTQYLVDEYGYDTKQALHAYRILDFLERFANTGFNDFEEAIWYKNKYLLDFKKGKCSLEEYKEIADDKLKKIKDLKDKFKSQGVDEKTKNKLSKIVREIVRINILK